MLDTLTSRLHHMRTLAQKGGAPHHVLHTELMKDFAALNGLGYSEADFGLDTLARGGVTDSMHDREDSWRLRSSFDHLSFLRRDRRAAMMVTEPYTCADLEALPDYLQAAGLVMHRPPNPLASFWWPNCANFIAITRADFGPVRWLDEQLALAPYEPPGRGQSKF